MDNLIAMFAQQEEPPSPKKPPPPQNEPPPSPKDTSSLKTTPSVEAKSPQTPPAGWPADRSYPPEALLRARRASEVKKAAMQWLNDEQERQKRLEDKLESEVGEAID